MQLLGMWQKAAWLELSVEDAGALECRPLRRRFLRPAVVPNLRLS